MHNLAHTVKVAYLFLLSAFGTMDDTLIFGSLALKIILFLPKSSTFL